jgi:hypothetical protein
MKNQQSTGFFINRMPICQMVYKEAAIMLNHEPEFSKSLATARAIFFAAAKKGFKNKNGKHYNGLNSPNLEMPAIYSIPFAGIDAFCMETPNGTRSCLLDGTIFNSDTYDKVVQRIITLVGENGYQKMVNEIQNRLSKLTEDQLNSDEVFTVYASLRDKIRSNSFINS